MANKKWHYSRAPRIRTVKPQFFTHEGLYDLEKESGLPVRLGFEGLWCCCDRDGRFHWRPRYLKTHILPYDDVDFSRVLDALATRGFVVKYVIGMETYGFVPSFIKHQSINFKEAKSDIPPPSGHSVAEADIQASLPGLGRPSLTGDSRVVDALSTRDAMRSLGREGKGSSKPIAVSTNVLTASQQQTNGHAEKGWLGSLPLRGGGVYLITESECETLAGLYPDVDLKQEFRNMLGWLNANPKKLKHLSGIKRFIDTWLKKEQRKVVKRPAAEKDFAGARKKTSDGGYKL